MNLVEHYIRLRSAYPDKEEMPVTVAELAETLCCTRRNVKHLIRKMEERKWIRWMPGSGRGNRSVLIFLRGLEEMAVSHFTELLEKGRIHDAMEFLRRGELPEGCGSGAGSASTSGWGCRWSRRTSGGGMC